ncbi:NAD(P)/FAD-dependent oxidoreductase [Tenacibaculum xiamenense]|uniref:NAD(P)/FAD-dependent oxidoreductase n=1 Tax=Tenacibaculum xiamenense TaxID=1261553 RepID=UPI003895AE21
MTITNVIIVGAGPAGIGIASLLNKTDINYIILEKKEVGNSFSEWPETMEMITPSFPSNAFGQMDLNSICETTSPAFSFNKEHLSGNEYAEYLDAVADYFDIDVQTHTEVMKVHKQNGGWKLETNQGVFFSKYLVWAAGEFQNPEITNISGVEHCIHSSLIKYPDCIEGNDFVVIGGYESGVQMAFDLIKNHQRVTLINPNKIDSMETSDPSKVLSPYTYQKYRQLKRSKLYREVIGEVIGVSKIESNYQIELKDNTIINANNMPICATGFSLVKDPIEEFVIEREDGTPKLEEKTDEFFGQKNMYLAGPSVRHDNHIFCFIYKFRQRFGVIVEDILKKEDYDKKGIELLVNTWKVNGMYLSDLSCCADECVC